MVVDVELAAEVIKAINRIGDVAQQLETRADSGRIINVTDGLLRVAEALNNIADAIKAIDT